MYVYLFSISHLFFYKLLVNKCFNSFLHVYHVYHFIFSSNFDLLHNFPIFQELAEKERWTHQDYPAVLIKEEEKKNIVKAIDNSLYLKSTVSWFMS